MHVLILIFIRATGLIVIFDSAVIFVSGIFLIYVLIMIFITV